MGKRTRRPPGQSPNPRRGERWRTIAIVVSLVVGLGVVLALNLVGAGRRPTGSEAPGEHDHPPGPHGGAVVVIDKENRYHAEAVAGPRGVMRVYMYGQELSVPRPVPARVVCGAVRGDGEEFPLMLRPEPLADDPPGTTSRFVARLPSGRPSGDAKLVVRSLEIGSDRFQFTLPLSTPNSERDGDAIRADAALYTTPGGRYTAKDISTNGQQPAARKFSGERPRHDDRPAVGERVCPVSRERADARFTWVVGGKEYQFCCPPCIDEFLITAKERPDEIRDPEFYRQP